MIDRLLLVAVLVILLGTIEPTYSQSDSTPTTAEQRLIDDRRTLPVPEDAKFNEMISNDYAMMLTSGAPTDDPQAIYPALRIFVFAVPGSCSVLESFYQQHWTEFKFLVDASSGMDQFVAFLSWHGDELHQVPVKSIHDIDDSAEGITMMASQHAPRTQNSSGYDLMRDLLGFSNDADYCSVIAMNSRRVKISDIPLSVRGVRSGDVYSSVTGLFNVVVPSADNFAVNRFSVSESSEQEAIRFVEEVSFLIGDFGELYRAGVVQLNQQLVSLAETGTEGSIATELAQVALARHFGGELPGEFELSSAEQIATDYGQAAQALYRVKHGSMLVEITGFDPLESSTPSDALVAVMVVPIGKYLIFATAQNDYLAGESDESVSVASINSKAANLINLLTWSRELPGDVELPDSLKSPVRRPHLEQCVRQFNIDEGVAFENTCDRRIAFQILMIPDQDNVIEYTIRSGETLRLEIEERRFAFAACPSGYATDRTFDGENLRSILASQYNCLQQ